MQATSIRQKHKYMEKDSSHKVYGTTRAIDRRWGLMDSALSQVTTELKAICHARIQSLSTYKEAATHLTKPRL